jgi:hypothetical protein
VARQGRGCPREGGRWFRHVAAGRINKASYS